MRAYMTEKAIKEMEELFKLKNRGIDILELVVSEWETDPMSVQCFDLRIVNEAKILIKRLRKLDILHGSTL